MRFRGRRDEGSLDQTEIRTYMSPLQRFRRLMAQEQQEQLFSAYKNGKQFEGQSARDLIVYTNVPLVISIARHYTGVGMSFRDLITEGVCGMLKALEHFDPTMGSFATYAGYWIRQSIDRAIIETAGILPFRLPHQLEQNRRMVYRASRQFRDVHDRDPDVDELMEVLKTMGTKMGEDITRERVISCLEMTGVKSISLQAKAKNPDRIDMPAIVPELARVPRTAYPDARLYAKQEIIQLRLFFQRIFRTLEGESPRDQEIFLRRFGLQGRPVGMLEEIGKEFGLSKERIRQVEGRILRSTGSSPGEIREALQTIRDLAEIAGEEFRKSRPIEDP